MGKDSNIYIRKTIPFTKGQYRMIENYTQSVGISMNYFLLIFKVIKEIFSTELTNESKELFIKLVGDEIIKRKVMNSNHEQYLLEVYNYKPILIKDPNSFEMLSIEEQRKILYNIYEYTLTIFKNKVEDKL